MISRSPLTDKIPTQFLGHPLSPGNPILLEALPVGALPYLCARDLTAVPFLLIAVDEERAEQLTADLVAFGISDPYLLLSESSTPWAGLSSTPEIGFSRNCLRSLFINNNMPRVIVTSVATLMARWMPDNQFIAHSLTLTVGDEITITKVVDILLSCGYFRAERVEDVGSFSVRGGVVDIFPPYTKQPLRCDFFGDEIDTIKEVVIDPNKTLSGLVKSIQIYPLREVVYSDDNSNRAITALREQADRSTIPTGRVSELVAQIEQRHFFYGIDLLWPSFFDSTDPLLETLLKDGRKVVIADNLGVERAIYRRESLAKKEQKECALRHEAHIETQEHMLAAEMTWQQLYQHTVIAETPLIDDVSEVAAHSGISLLDDLTLDLLIRRQGENRAEETDDAHTHVDLLTPLENLLRRRAADEQSSFLCCANRIAAERMREILSARHIDLPIVTLGDALKKIERSTYTCTIVLTALRGTFVDNDRGIAWICEGDIFGHAASGKTSAVRSTGSRGRGRKKRPKRVGGLGALQNLAKGDLVIHIDHGIGRYLGLCRLVLGGVDGEFAHLEYASGDKLYLPVYLLNLLQVYHGPDSAKIDKLGGVRWEKSKQRVKDAVLSIAHKLLAVQAQRDALEGEAMEPPGDEYRRFVAAFPFVETEDQAKAIEEVERDLQTKQPMDRLICGDVGFGKTEVALRAAYLTILSGKQVAVLVPTTVLAEQHGQRFQERFMGHAVNISVLNRFRSNKESVQIKQGLKNGGIDIVVATHKLLSDGLQFKNLGLLVVDEEQRFGVGHKERLKQLKTHVDLLTLSATPIPRTLHMATMGLRDLSVIQTPPTTRSPIATTVTRFDEGLIRDVIRKELHRGGQIFFIHNRVQSIEAMHELLSHLVPEARIAVGHGQMSGGKLEGIMVDFVRRKFDLLLCTTIIESGIDIPSANTMIINRADTFGLSQLHQLRGRIGRGEDRAHAYLLLPRGERITEDANKRLNVLKRHTELGSGFHIASRDLDIRGAGDLLGTNQAGHIQAVGFELYTTLLQEAVERARGERGRSRIEPDIKIPVSAVLPEDYIHHTPDRLAYYQRLSIAQSNDEIREVLSEIEALYGEPPVELLHLGELMYIRLRLQHLGVQSLGASVVEDNIKVGIFFVPELASAAIDHVAMAILLQKEPETYRLLPSGRLAITVPTLVKTTSLHLMQRLLRILEELPER